MQQPRLVHDVYFTLKDNAPEARRRLVDACYDRLADIPGVAFLAAGTRDADKERDVNDAGYDVSLHVHFAEPDAHDGYQDHAEHRRFIAENQDNWTRVRVFDSTIAAR